MRTDTPQTIYLKDYTPPPYKVAHTELSFNIFDGKTIVTSKTQYTTNNDTEAPLFLEGEELKLVSCKLDGKEVQPKTSEKGLTLPCPGKDIFTLEIVTEICPEKNTALEGLYYSGGTYCTQCEAQGFRKITYYPDRPDVMATFKVTVEADKKSCPVLLSNGNLINSGDAKDGRHFTVWEDPTPKGCYLFALVAGDLERVSDKFTTQSGTDVDLHIYVKPGDETQCAHAMESLKKSMKWDEEVYGREYQYSIFNIVAVSDFNMGAMENTSLNIFNTALVLAQQETATDTDYIRVESVIAHEYFHNWTGNRVTCRDWFQLSLKEGLTVFRDQEFSADMNSPSVQRIDDVTHLRRSQFPEDASPLAHPVRPESYIEINNFYTMTVYEKGAEVIRMFRTLLGSETYRKATDLYFERFDGKAVTIDDWAQCMSDASGMDLDQFKLWYSQAGTPQIKASGKYDKATKTYELTLEQTIPDTPGQSHKKPMHIPVAFGLVGPNGDDMIETQILHLQKRKQSFKFENIGAKPVPSILRNFSAPVKLTTDLTNKDLRFLMVHDSDGFNRWEAGQKFYLNVINKMIDDNTTEAPQDFLEAIGLILEQAKDSTADRALLARALTLPDISIIAQTRDVVDPSAIDKVRSALQKAVKSAHKTALKNIYELCAGCESFSITPAAMGRRALRNTLLEYLTATEGTGCAKLATMHYETANNMTDKMAALVALVPNKNADRDGILDHFHEQFKNYKLVMDKWFGVQASANRDDIFDQLEWLKAHPDFSMTNPNRVRSLYGAFAMNNPVAFHDKSGRGYEFLKDAIIELNAINPQIAARMVTPLREWKRYTPDRQEKMKAALQEIANLENLSPNVFEIVTKSLNS
ncbi:MAG TPA: aminopeptidase N [Alphaproteobacteria bacterium]|nr:aminopeptidase N [Alphaproteobacteria bacterium]